MKRLLSVLLALAMTVSMTVTAFAKGGKAPASGSYSGIAELDNGPEFDPGETITLNIDYFYGKWKEKVWDENKGRDVNVTVDVEDEPLGYLDKDYHKVTATWSSGGQYIQNVYFEDGDSFISIELKGEVATTDREVTGTIRIRESGVPNRDSITYECKIKKGALVIKGVDEKSRMVSNGDKTFGLPDDYQTKQVRFNHDEDGSYGTFIGDFYSKNSGRQLAMYRVRILDQKSLYLGFSESVNKTVANKYPDAELTFINWTARPTFEYAGKLYIYAEPDEYVYGIKDDNTLYNLGATYDDDEYAYLLENVKTLGSYVISDTKLNASGTSSSGGSSSSGSSGGGGGGTTLTPSSSAAPSSAAPSSVAPPPASSVAPPPASSVAPPSASSAAPSSSSEESSSEPEESSEPEDEEPEDPDDEDPYDPDEDDEDGDDEDEKKTEKKKFPLVPVLLGVLGIVILVCAVVVVGNRNSRSRSRRRRYDDDWDD